MLKQWIYKLGSVAMALTLLFSTISFTVEKHFCGDTLIDVAIFSPAEKCAMEASEMEQQEVIKKSCCKDTLDLIEGQDLLTKNTFDDLDFQQELFLIAYLDSYRNLFQVVPKQHIPHKHYIPPNLVLDIQVLDQVFII